MIPSSLDDVPVMRLWSGGEKRSIFGWSNASVVSVVIPNSVTSIEMFAFQNCTGLTSLMIPDSVTYIGNWAFYGCSALESVIIPESVTNIRESSFSGCSRLTNVSLPPTATNIGVNAFTYCTSLRSITIPNSVRSIGLRAFSGCSNLASVIVGSNVTSIGVSAFSSADNLADILCRGSAPSDSAWADRLPQDATIYYLPGASGWPPIYGGRSTRIFRPAVVQSSFTPDAGFQFSWTNTGLIPMSVRRATSLDGPWTVVSTNNATSQFVDPSPLSGKAFYQAYLP